MQEDRVKAGYSGMLLATRYVKLLWRMNITEENNPFMGW